MIVHSLSSYYGIFLSCDTPVSLLLTSGYSPWRNGLELAGLVLLCILVVAASYFVTRFVGGRQLTRQKNSNFKVVDVCPIGNNKQLQLIKAGTRYIVVAVCKDSVTMITELSEDEVLIKNEVVKEGSGFKDIFAGILNKKNNTDNDEENKTKE